MIRQRQPVGDTGVTDWSPDDYAIRVMPDGLSFSPCWCGRPDRKFRRIRPGLWRCPCGRGADIEAIPELGLDLEMARHGAGPWWWRLWIKLTRGGR